MHKTHQCAVGDKHYMLIEVMVIFGAGNIDLITIDFSKLAFSTRADLLHKSGLIDFIIRQ